MNIRRVLAIVLRYLYLLKGSPARFLPLFAWVAVDILLWGFITRYLNSVAAPGYNFVPAMLGAVLLWDFFTRVMQGVTTAFFEDVWSRRPGRRRRPSRRCGRRRRRPGRPCRPAGACRRRSRRPTGCRTRRTG